MKLYDFLQFSVCMFSVLAAGFWLQAATSKLPKAPNDLGRSVGGSPFAEALTIQSRWTAAGAASAGIAAFSASLAAVLPYV